MAKAAVPTDTLPDARETPCPHWAVGLVALVRAGATFVNGHLIERPAQAAVA